MAIVMYTDRNTIIRQYLGAINCGQYILKEKQQFEVYSQIITHLINNDPSLKNAIPKDFADKPCLPYFQQTSPYDRYFTDNHIVNLARANHISLSEATKQIGEQIFSVHMDNLFGYKYPETGYKSEYAPRSLFLELKSDYRSPMLPEFFKFNDLEFKLYFTLQYSETDGDFLAGEVFYYDKSGKYFPINISYKRRIEENPDSVKEIILGYNFNHSILLNKNLMVDHSHKPIVLFHDKIIAAILSNTHDSFPFIPSTYNFTYTNCKIDLSDLKYRDVILVPLPQIESYMSVLKLAEMLEDKHKATVRICNYSIFPSNQFEINTSITSEEYAIQEIVEHAIPQHNVQWDKFLSDDKHLLRRDQYDRWLEHIGLKYNTEANDSLKLMNFSDLSSVQSRDDKQYELHEILAPQTVSFCYGSSGAGKSIWSLSIALSFACGFDIFDFSSTSKKKVLYIDYETSPDTFKSNIEQLIAAYHLDIKTIDSNFKYHLRKLNSQIGYIWKNNQETEYIKYVYNLIKREQISLVIIDTLVKAAPSALNFNSSKEFMNYIECISEQLNIALLIIHHANNEGNMDGSSNFYKLATNVFYLNQVPTEAPHQGIITEIIYSKVNRSPRLDNHKERYFLQFSGNDQSLSWVRYESPIQDRFDENIINKNFTSWDTHIYESDENQIIGLLVKANSPLSIKEMNNLLGNAVTAHTLQNRIKNINAKSNQLKIIKEGKGPKTVYKLTMNGSGGQQEPAAS